MKTKLSLLGVVHTWKRLDGFMLVTAASETRERIFLAALAGVSGTRSEDMPMGKALACEVV